MSNQDSLKSKLNIRLNNWMHTCADGCCTTYGTDIFVNGVKLLQVDESADTVSILEIVLQHLGYDVTIEQTSDNYL